MKMFSIIPEVVYVIYLILITIQSSCATSDPNDNVSVQHDESHEVPGEPLSPSDFKNAENISPQGMNSTAVNTLERTDLFEGDIVIRKGREKNAASDPTQKWPNAVVPYLISSHFGEHDRSVIARAILEFHHQTCIRFKPRTSENDYVMLKTGDGCNSPVGRVGGAQYVTLGQGCIHPGIVMHELTHTVGFWHEQSRWDRDDHVTVNYDNIQPGMEENFRKMSWKDTQNLSAPYDTSSIMHYGPFAFSKNRQRQYKTITSKYPNEKMGQRENFTEIDVYQINKLYKCIKQPTTEPSAGSASGPSTTPATTTTSTDSEGNDTSKCTDNHKDCQKWASSGECQKNPDWMLVNCKKSCNQCRSSCTNNNKHCETWAANGECSKNPGYMHSHCAKACKKCKEG